MFNDDDIEKKQAEDTRIVKASKDRIIMGQNIRERKLRYSQLGLCAKCHSLHAETTQYGQQRYWCANGERRRPLSPNDPIIDCTDYWDVAHQSLKDLMALAVPLYIDVNKNPIGFIYRDPEDPYASD